MGFFADGFPFLDMRLYAYNLSWTPALGDPQSVVFKDHAHKFCKDVSIQSFYQVHNFCKDLCIKLCYPVNQDSTIWSFISVFFFNLTWNIIICTSTLFFYHPTFSLGVLYMNMQPTVPPCPSCNDLLLYFS